jgi:hypothetical protein
VVDSPARGSLGTGAGAAHRATGLTDVVTDLVSAAVGVSATLHVDTGNEWVALEAGSADTPGLVEVHLTLCTAATGPVRVQAGVHTVLLHAGLVDRTVIIDPALGSVALAVRIPSVALRTGADRVVHPGHALGLWGARVLHDARVDAVLLDASLVHGTLRVCSALWAGLDRVAIGERVSREARRTVAADGVRANGADRVGCTWVGSDTGVDTTPVPADLLVPTLTVGSAARLGSRRDLAIYICIPDIARDTHANHGPLRQRVVHGALCIPAAGVELGAGVPADLLQTGLPTGAVTVHSALRLRLRDGETACSVGIALVVGDALAPSPVTTHDAVGVDSAVTRVYAFLIPACQHLGTLVVHHTLGVVALGVGVASPAVGAVAPGSVVSRLTQSSHATLGEAAGVDALPVDALVRQRTLQVAVTARQDACCVGVSSQRFGADAGGPVVVDPADGLRAALLGDAGVTALLTDTCKVKGTFGVGGAFGPGWFSNRGADLVCISFVARRTDTSGPVGPDLAESIDPALVVIHAGIFAFLADTCKSSGTVLVNRALRLALHEGVALQSRGTGALTHTPCRPSDRVLTAGARFARVKYVRLYDWRPDTLDERVSSVAGEAGAHWGVVPHVTLSVTTAHSGARIVTLVVATRPVQRTVAVDNTLGLALDIGVSVIERRTRADTLLPDLTGRQGAPTTRVGVAGVVYDGLGLKAAASEGVPDVSW